MTHRDSWPQIDAEGYDAYLVSQLDMDRWLPQAVGLETINLRPLELLGTYRMLLARGFTIHSDGRDLFASKATPPPSSS